MIAAPRNPRGSRIKRPNGRRNALSRLHELATRVAADVGEHSSRVQEISKELTAHAGDANEPDAEVLGTVARIIEANGRLQEQLKSAEVKLQEQAHEIEVREADALTDVLTGVANRRAFNAELARRIAEWQRRETPFCLLMVDVDHFKKFNDQHGHLAGDAVLRGVAQGLQQSVRQMDIVARYGGEEFAVITPATTLTDAEPGAIRLGGHIAGCQFDFEGKTLKVTVSGGLAQVLTGEDEASLIKRADEALYSAKRAGRNCVFAHTGATTRPAGAISPEGRTLPPGADGQAASEPTAGSAADSASAGASAGRRGRLRPVPDRRSNRPAESDLVLRGNSPPRGRVASLRE